VSLRIFCAAADKLCAAASKMESDASPAGFSQLFEK
jgi:hypothetical protein